MIGKFDAKISDYGVSETKSGNPQVFVRFAFNDNDGAQKELTWYGSFVGGAKDITLKTLIYCGLKPQHFGQLVNLANGIASGMLDTQKVLNIDVQEEPKQDGGMRTVIQWVNDPASAPQIKKIDQAKNAQYFGQMGPQYEGDLMRLAGDLGVPLNNGGQNTMGNPQQNMGNMNNAQGANNGQGQATQYNQQNAQGGGSAQGASNFNQQNGGGQQQNMNQNQGQNQNFNQQNNNGQNFAAPF